MDSTSKKVYTFAVDCNGGDYPREVIIGAHDAVLEHDDLSVIMVGDIRMIDQTFRQEGLIFDKRIDFRHNQIGIGMDESFGPEIVNRSSSMRQVMLMAQEGEADGSFSCGKTSAMMLLIMSDIIKKIPGLVRPGLAALLPGRLGPVVMLDAGINYSCSKHALIQFGIIANEISRTLTGKENPIIGQFNVGSEDCSGNEIAKTILEELRRLGVNASNVEGDHLLDGTIDAVIGTGLLLNGSLKTTEGSINEMNWMLKQSFSKNWYRKVLAYLLKRAGAFDDMKNRMSESNNNGALIAGVDGLEVKGHGKSKRLAVKNGLEHELLYAKHQLVQKITDLISP